MGYIKKEEDFLPKLSNHMTLLGSLISAVATVVCVTWTLQGFMNNTNNRVSILESDHKNIKEEIAGLKVALQRQEDKVDKIYVLVLNQGGRHANID